MSMLVLPGGKPLNGQRIQRPQSPQLQELQQALALAQHTADVWRMIANLHRQDLDQIIALPGVPLDVIAAVRAGLCVAESVLALEAMRGYEIATWIAGPREYIGQKEVFVRGHPDGDGIVAHVICHPRSPLCRFWDGCTRRGRNSGEVLRSIRDGVLADRDRLRGQGAYDAIDAQEVSP